MKTTIAIATLLVASWAHAQETARPAEESSLRIIPAVKTTALVKGENYAVARDENNKIVFVRIEAKQKFISPILIQVEEPKKNN